MSIHNLKQYSSEQERRVHVCALVNHIHINKMTVKHTLERIALLQWPCVVREPWCLSFQYGVEPYELLHVCTGFNDVNSTRIKFIEWHTECFAYL